MAEKKDCFGYSKIAGRCMVLNDTYCKYPNEICRFYKTRKEKCSNCKLGKGSAQCLICNTLE